MLHCGQVFDCLQEIFLGAKGRERRGEIESNLFLFWPVLLDVRPPTEHQREDQSQWEPRRNHGFKDLFQGLHFFSLS